MNRHDASIPSVASRMRGPAADRLCVAALRRFMSLNVGKPIHRTLDLAQTNAEPGNTLRFRRTTRRRLPAKTCHETGSDGLGTESCCAGAVAIRIVRCPCGGGQTRGQPSKYARLYFCPSCRVRIRGTADTEDAHPFVCGCIHGVSGRSRSH